MSQDHRSLVSRVVRKLAIGAAAFPLVASVMILGSTGAAGASSASTLTIAQASNDVFCFPRAPYAPANSPRICWTAKYYVAALPAYARSSNSRFELCDTMLGVVVAGDVIELPEVIAFPGSVGGFMTEVFDEAELYETCRG